MSLIIDCHGHYTVLPKGHDAWREEQWGFFILEFVWALVSGWGIVERLRGREPAAAH